MAMKSKIGIGLGVVVILAVAPLLWVGYTLFSTGFSAKTPPHPIEVALARQIRHLAIPYSLRNTSNPIKPSPDVMAEALKHFADHCATCHANTGSGKTPIGQNVYPPAPDLRLPPTQSMSDGELFFIIHNGIRFTAMPAWGTGPPEEDQDSWKLVHFIRHMPDLTEEELVRMKFMNPVSRPQLAEEKAIERFLMGEGMGEPSGGHAH